jgi:hypothetical protein
MVGSLRENKFSPGNIEANRYFQQITYAILQQTAQIRFQIRGRLDGEFTARAWGNSQMPAKDEWCDAPVRQA